MSKSHTPLFLTFFGYSGMQRLAVSLCRVLFHAVKLNDALLLMSILSEEDLDVLKGRGYQGQYNLGVLQTVGD